MARDRNPLWVFGPWVAAAAFTVLAVLFWRYTVDDAFISLRYARHVAAGWGFVFNRVGPPVEGYTNFLWVVLEAILFKTLPATDVLPVAKALGIVFGLGTLCAIVALARRLYGDAAAFAASVLFALTGNMAFWSVAGLETPLYLLCLVAGIYSLLRAEAGPAWIIAAAVWWLAAALTRPEGAVMATAAFVLTIFLMPGYRRKSFVAAGIFALLYGGYFVWRWRYFGSFLPNTFYARAGAGIDVYYHRIKELAPFILYAVPPAILVLWRGMKGGNRPAILTGILAGLAFLLAFIAKREWMPGYRYELPFLAVLWVLAAGAATAGWERRKWLSKAVISVVLAAYAFLVTPPLFRELSYGGNLGRAHIALGHWLASAAPADPSLAAWDMGALPYYSDFPVIYDLNPEGLLSTATTRRGYDPAAVLKTRPAFIVLYSASYTRVSAPRYHWAWQIYRNRDFLQYYRYLFTFRFSDSNNLRVYKRYDITVAPPVFEAGERAARASATP